jgi:hypothetical protein
MIESHHKVIARLELDMKDLLAARATRQPTWSIVAIFLIVIVQWFFIGLQRDFDDSGIDVS